MIDYLYLQDYDIRTLQADESFEAHNGQPGGFLTRGTDTHGAVESDAVTDVSEDTPGEQDLLAADLCHARSANV